MSTACALSLGPGVLRPYLSTPQVSVVTWGPQGPQGQGEACTAILRGSHPHQPELPQDTRKQREVPERADSLVTPALLIRLYGPRGALPASSGQLRPPSCSRAHRSHLQRWRPGRNSENRGSRCRNPKVTMGPREGRLASSPRPDGSEPGATLLWASGS